MNIVKIQASNTLFYFKIQGLFIGQKFYALEIEDWGILFLSCLSFCPPLWTFNLANKFWTGSVGALIFHMSIPCDKTFQRVLLFWPCDLGVWPFFKKTLTLPITFKQGVLALIFHMNIPWDKALQWVQQFWPYDLDVWPTIWILLILLKTFELEVLVFIHITWIFVVVKSFHGYQHFFTLWPWNLTCF